MRTARWRFLISKWYSQGSVKYMTFLLWEAEVFYYHKKKNDAREKDRQHLNTTLIITRYMSKRGVMVLRLAPIGQPKWDKNQTLKKIYIYIWFYHCTVFWPCMIFSHIPEEFLTFLLEHDNHSTLNCAGWHPSFNSTMANGGVQLFGVVQVTQCFIPNFILETQEVDQRVMSFLLYIYLYI